MWALVGRLWSWLTFAEVRAEIAATRREIADLKAELELLTYALEHPGEWVVVPAGHPARNGALAHAWRQR